MKAGEVFLFQNRSSGKILPEEYLCIEVDEELGPKLEIQDGDYRGQISFLSDFALGTWELVKKGQAKKYIPYYKRLI